MYSTIISHISVKCQAIGSIAKMAKFWWKHLIYNKDIFGCFCSIFLNYHTCYDKIVCTSSRWLVYWLWIVWCLEHLVRMAQFQQNAKSIIIIRVFSPILGIFHNYEILIFGSRWLFLFYFLVMKGLLILLLFSPHRLCVQFVWSNTEIVYSCVVMAPVSCVQTRW